MRARLGRFDPRLHTSITGCGGALAITAGTRLFLCNLGDAPTRPFHVRRRCTLPVPVQHLGVVAGHLVVVPVLVDDGRSQPADVLSQLHANTGSAPATAVHATLPSSAGHSRTPTGDGHAADATRDIDGPLRGLTIAVDAGRGGPAVEPVGGGGYRVMVVNADTLYVDAEVKLPVSHGPLRHVRVSFRSSKRLRGRVYVCVMRKNCVFFVSKA